MAQRKFENINQRLINSFQITLYRNRRKTAAAIPGKIAGSLGDLLKGVKVGVDSGAFDPLFKYLDIVGGNIAQWLVP